MPLWSIPLVFVGAFVGGTGIMIGIGALMKRAKARKEAKVLRVIGIGTVTKCVKARKEAKVQHDGD